MISKDLQKIYAGDTSTRYIETVELSHPLFSKTFYLANDYEAHEFWLDSSKQQYQEFQPFPFQLKLPDKNTGGSQELNLVMCNVGRELVKELEAAIKDPTKTIDCTYRVYIDRTDHKLPENSPPLELHISDITIDVETVTATATRFDVLSKPFPSTIYMLDEFPGLRR